MADNTQIHTLLRELCDKLKEDPLLRQQFVSIIHEIMQFMRDECDLIEMMTLQAKHDRIFQQYLKEYKSPTSRDDE